MLFSLGENIELPMNYQSWIHPQASRSLLMDYGKGWDD